jgi:putative ABC transport system permease protein
MTTSQTTAPTTIRVDAPTEAGRVQSSFYAVQECLRSALASIRAHGLRSFLTMLGIIIGVASVICVIALVQGLSQSISQQFQGLGSNTLTLRAETPFEDALRGKRNRLRTTDLDQLKFRIDGIKNVTPVVFASGRGGADVRNGSNVAAGQMFGTTESYQEVQQTFPKYGLNCLRTRSAASFRSATNGSRWLARWSHAAKCLVSARIIIC